MFTAWGRGALGSGPAAGEAILFAISSFHVPKNHLYDGLDPTFVFYGWAHRYTQSVSLGGSISLFRGRDAQDSPLTSGILLGDLV